MIEDISRREILKSTASTAATAAWLTGVSSANSQPSVELIEGGVYYDVPARTDYASVHFDSHPRYTVTNKGYFVAPKRVLSKYLTDNDQDNAIVGEDSLTSTGKTNLDFLTAKSKTLPISLSERCRVTDAISLADEHDIPEVTLHWNSNGVSATVNSLGQITVPEGEVITKKLSTQKVTAKTVRTTDEIVEIEGMPEDTWGPKREFGTTEIEVTPQVKLANRGELKPVAKEFV